MQSGVAIRVVEGNDPHVRDFLLCGNSEMLVFAQHKIRCLENKNVVDHGQMQCQFRGDKVDVCIHNDGVPVVAEAVPPEVDSRAEALSVLERASLQRSARSMVEDSDILRSWGSSPISRSISVSPRTLSPPSSEFASHDESTTSPGSGGNLANRYEGGSLSEVLARADERSFGVHCEDNDVWMAVGDVSEDQHEERASLARDDVSMEVEFGLEPEEWADIDMDMDMYAGDGEEDNESLEFQWFGADHANGVESSVREDGKEVRRQDEEINRRTDVEARENREAEERKEFSIRQSKKRAIEKIGKDVEILMIREKRRKVTRRKDPDRHKEWYGWYQQVRKARGRLVVNDRDVQMWKESFRLQHLTFQTWLDEMHKTAPGRTAISETSDRYDRLLKQSIRVIIAELHRLLTALDWNSQFIIGDTRRAATPIANSSTLHDLVMLVRLLNTPQKGLLDAKVMGEAIERLTLHAWLKTGQSILPDDDREDGDRDGLGCRKVMRLHATLGTVR